MEHNESVLGHLHKKIDEILGRLHGQHEEIERLRNELTIARAECEAKDNEIGRLNEDLSSKDRDLEGMVNKIEEALSR